MDANQVKTFCDIAATLLVPLGEYAACEVAERKPADDALIRQLRVAGGAIANALDTVARMTPPVMPLMPAPPPAPAPPQTEQGS